MEVWKVCLEDGNYDISNLGNCRRKKHNGEYIEIKGSVNNRGYKYFQIQRNGKRKNYLFHQMVAYCFIGDRPILDGGKVDIDHIDRNKLNNRVDNLRYITHKENLQNEKRFRDDVKGTRQERTNILLAEWRERTKEEKKYYCSLCDVASTCNAHLEVHKNGYRHKLKKKYKDEMEKHGIQWTKENYLSCKEKVYKYNDGERKSKPLIYPL